MNMENNKDNPYPSIQPSLPNLPRRPCDEPPCNPVPIDNGIFFMILIAILVGSFFSLQINRKIKNITTQK